jgi:hypothetical protein
MKLRDEYITIPKVSEWERKTPEDEIRRWQYFDTKQEKRNADKQVILERYSSIPGNISSILRSVKVLE